MESTSNKSKRSPEEFFTRFFEAEDCAQILHSFKRLVNLLGIKSENSREFYQSLKGKLQTWKCKSLWELLDNRANHKDYDRGTTCEHLQVLVIGAGPIGLRTAIEMALLGAQVVVVEKRTSFARNNVLHLWPFLIDDFRSLGAKRFYGKFCSGAINHISIRRLQSILLKTALIFGVKVFTGVTFNEVVEPASEDEGWKCHVTPENHPINEYEIDVVIGADGKKNVLPGFAQIEMRGSLAIGITVNFVNHYTEPEVNVEEISGIAYQFNPAFFDKLYQQKGIKLENIVYYKDETHYFVMTAAKASLLERGVLKKDYVKDSAQLLADDNVNQDELMRYVIDTVHYATRGQLDTFEFKITDRGQPDVAVFDFTSIKKAENSARIRERKGSKLLIGLVGDSLLEPFWPTGSGCARGVLSALDAAWMVRSFAQDKPPLQILSERENIYRLLSGTSNENLHKNHAAYSINPCTRYKTVPHRKLDEVYHLYDTDDPVNADYSLGSPLSYLGGSKKRTISTGAKPTMGKKKNRLKVGAQLSVEKYSANPSPCSSIEDVSSPRMTGRKTPLNDFTSGGEDASEYSGKRGKKKGKKVKKADASVSSPEEVSGGKTSGKKGKKSGKKSKVFRVISSPVPDQVVPVEEKHSRKRSFFGFGRSRKAKLSRATNVEAIASLENVEENVKPTQGALVEGSSRKASITERKGSVEGRPFQRGDPNRRSAREIIAEMEARTAKNSEVAQLPKDRKRPMRRSVTTGNLKGSLEAFNQEREAKGVLKRATSDVDIRTPPPKQGKQVNVWDDIKSLSPKRSESAVPVLSQMSPGRNDDGTSHRDVSSGVRMAAMLAMATPLLMDDCRLNGDRGLSKLSTGARGLVRNAVNKFNSLNTPKTRDPVHPRTLDMGELAIDQTDDKKDSNMLETQNPQSADQYKDLSGKDQVKTLRKPPSPVIDWGPTAIAHVEGKTPPKLCDVANKHRAKMTRQVSLEMCEKMLTLSRGFSYLDEESTDSPDSKSLNPKIYQKTFISALEDNKENNSKATESNRDETSIVQKTPKTGRAAPSFSSPEIYRMEKLLESLTETLAKDRARASLRFLINVFRLIHKNPKDDKFRRIYKSRVKFKKFVWTVRNAKLFMTVSGWVEVGSFLVFPLTKSTEEPITILTKYLESLAGSPSLVKPLPDRGLRFSNATPKSKDPTTTKRAFSVPSKSISKLNIPKQSLETSQTTANTPSDGLNRFFSTPRSSKLDEEITNEVKWDVEMEDPLRDISNSKLENGRLGATSFDMSDVSFLKKLQWTPKSKGVTPKGPISPDPAIMEEIDGLSNTLDDLILSLNDVDTAEPVENVDIDQADADCKALYSTLDYLLNSEDEDEIACEAPYTKPRSTSLVDNLSCDELRPKSAFIRVSSLKSCKEIEDLRSKMGNKKSVVPAMDRMRAREGDICRPNVLSARRQVKGKGVHDVTNDTRSNTKASTQTTHETKPKAVNRNIQKITTPVKKEKRQRREIKSSVTTSKPVPVCENTKTPTTKMTSSLLLASSHTSASSPVEKLLKKKMKSSPSATSSPGALSPVERLVERMTPTLMSSSTSPAKTKSPNFTVSTKPASSSGQKEKVAVRKKSTSRKLPALPQGSKLGPTSDKVDKERMKSEMLNKEIPNAAGKLETDIKLVKKNSVTRDGSQSNLPPSGRESQRRKARSKKADDIAAKLERLESGFESLCNSPLSKAESERSESQASGRTSVSSSVNIRSQSRTSGRESVSSVGDGRSVSRTSSRVSRISTTRAKDDSVSAGSRTSSLSSLSSVTSSHPEYKGSTKLNTSKPKISGRKSTNQPGAKIKGNLSKTESDVERKTSSSSEGYVGSNASKASRQTQQKSSMLRRQNSIGSREQREDKERKTVGRKGLTSSVSFNTRSKTKTRNVGMVGTEIRTDEPSARKLKDIAAEAKKNQVMVDNVTERRKPKKGSGTRGDNPQTFENAMTSLNDSFDRITVVDRWSAMGSGSDDLQSAHDPMGMLPDHKDYVTTNMGTNSRSKVDSGVTDCESEHGIASEMDRNLACDDVFEDAANETLDQVGGTLDHTADIPNGTHDQDTPLGRDSLNRMDGTKKQGTPNHRYNNRMLGHDMNSVTDEAQNANTYEIDQENDRTETIPVSNGNARNRTYPIPSLEERKSAILDAAKESTNKISKSVDDRRSIDRIKSRSVENLVYVKAKKLEKGKAANGSMLDLRTAPKKSRKFPFYLRKSKATSCVDLNAAIPEGEEWESSHSKNTANGKVLSMDKLHDTSTKASEYYPEIIGELSPSPRKSPKKKISPFRKIHLKRKSIADEA